jgi:hypothetical protein
MRLPQGPFGFFFGTQVPPEQISFFVQQVEPQQTCPFPQHLKPQQVSPLPQQSLLPQQVSPALQMSGRAGSQQVRPLPMMQPFPHDFPVGQHLPLDWSAHSCPLGQQVLPHASCPVGHSQAQVF